MITFKKIRLLVYLEKTFDPIGYYGEKVRGPGNNVIAVVPVLDGDYTGSRTTKGF